LNIFFSLEQNAAVIFFVSLLSRRSRQQERLSASMLSICLSVSVCLSPKCKKAIFSKTKQFSHIENHFRHILFSSFFNAVWALTSGGFRTVSDTLVLSWYC